MKEECCNCRYFLTFDCERYDCGTRGGDVYENEEVCRYYDDSEDQEA